MRGLWLAAAAALTLGACQKKTQTHTPAEAAGQAQSQAAAGAGTSSAAAPAARPLRRPGLWRMTMSSSGMNQQSELCVDQAVDETLGVSGQRPGTGPSRENRKTPRAGGGYEIESVCDLGDAGTVTTRGTASGDFDSDYKMQMESTTKGARSPQMNGTRRMTLEARWMGPCPAGMAPGDMTVAGMKTNPRPRDAGGAP
jgi:hypothetical protein